MAKRSDKYKGSLGENNGMVKLTKRKVRKIKKLYKGGGITQTELAKEYQVSQATISDILRGRTWVQVRI